MSEVRQARASRDGHDGHVRRFVLVLLPLRQREQRQRHGGRAREVLDAGRPVHRRHRARDPAPAVFALLDARHARPRPDAGRGAVRQPAHAGHGVEPDLFPQTGGRPHRLLQPGRRGRAARRQGRAGRCRAACGRPPSRDVRHRHDVEVEEQRRRPAIAGRDLRRRYGTSVHDVRGAARAVARMERRGRRRRIPLHEAAVEGGAPARAGRPVGDGPGQGGAVALAARHPSPGTRDVAQDHARHRHPAHLQHRDRRGDGAHERAREVRRPQRPGSRGHAGSAGNCGVGPGAGRAARVSRVVARAGPRGRGHRPALAAGRYRSPGTRRDRSGRAGERQAARARHGARRAPTRQPCAKRRWPTRAC